MKTITFYSYKGGVGRSLILANVAKRLTEIGKNVCMLDFDLEAPGLEFKFGDYESNDKKQGVVDFITSYTEGNVLPQDILEYTSVIKIGSRKHHGWLKLISAGDIYNNRYWKRLMSINWKKLFYTPDGKGYELILHLKALIEQQIKPDYLLVDSRTGITETSGITLSILADEVVVIAANNEENLFGSGMIIESIIQNSKEEKIRINFVLSRVPFTKDPKDREKEFDRITKIKNDFKGGGINLEDIHIIHSDRELEEEETLKIAEIEREGEICVDNDLLHFFDSVIKRDIPENELEAYNNYVKSQKLFLEARNSKDEMERFHILNSSIELDNENAPAYHLRAQIYEKAENLEKAEKDYMTFYKIAIHQFPENFRATMTAGSIISFYYRHKMFEEMIAFAEKEQMLKGDISIIGSALGNAYLMTGQDNKAVEVFESYIKANTDSPTGYFGMATIYIKQEKFEEAEKYIDGIIKRVPNHADALYSKANIQSKKGKTAEFYLYLNMALENDKSNTIKNEIALQPEFKKYYSEEAFQRILYKYNIRLKTEG